MERSNENMKKFPNIIDILPMFTITESETDRNAPKEMLMSTRDYKKSDKFKENLILKFIQWNQYLNVQLIEFERFQNQREPIDDMDIAYEHKLYLLEAPNFVQFLRETIEFHDSIILYLTVRKEMVEAIESTTNLLKSKSQSSNDN